MTLGISGFTQPAAPSSPKRAHSPTQAPVNAPVAGASSVDDTGRGATADRVTTGAGDALHDLAAGNRFASGVTRAATAPSPATCALTTAYRVEGAGNQRVVVGADGSVAIPKVLTRHGAERNLYLNFGDETRAKQFLQQRLGSYPDNAIKQFEVPTSFVDELRASAVPESERSTNPQRPVIADPTKAADQFGLSAPQIDRLRHVIVEGSGKQHGGATDAR